MLNNIFINPQNIYNNMAEYVEHQTPEMTHILSSLGYRLITRKSTMIDKSSRLGPEEAIIKVLTGHPDPRYIEGLPVIIAKNNVNYDVLLGLVRDLKEQDPHLPNKLGYILDITYTILKKVGVRKDYNKLESTITKLNKIKSSKESVIDPSIDTKVYRDFANSRRNERMKHWNIISLFDEDSFEKTLLLYINKEKNVQ